MATEKQIQYLNDLIEAQKISVENSMFPRQAERQFKTQRYPTPEQRRKMTREQRNELARDLKAILSDRLNSLNPEAMSKSEASEMIGALKSGAWAEEVIS